MGLTDIGILLLLAGWVGLALWCMRREKRRASKTGGCPGCSGSCPSCHGNRPQE